MEKCQIMNQLKKNMSKKQTDNQIIKEFEKEFSRIHRNGKDIGKHEPKWFFPEHITPRIVSDWLRLVLADQDKKYKQNIGFLRQWLNESRITDESKLVTNEEIEHFLNLKK